MGFTSVAIQFTAIDLLSRVVDRVKGRMSSLASANQDVQQSFDRMANSAKYAGYAGVATIALANGLRPAVTAAGNLQEAMLRVKGNLAGSAKDAADLQQQLAQVKSNAITISAEAPFSAEDVVNIQNSLLKAGVPLADISGKAGAAFAATALASLSGEAPEMIGNALAKIGGQFKLQGGQFGEIADWLVRVDDASATDIPTIIQGMTMAGSQANSLRISAKDTVTTLGALSNLTDRAGSSLDNMLKAMVPKTREQMKLLKKYKLDFFVEGRFVGMEAATDQLREKFGKIKDDEERDSTLQTIFGDEGGRAAKELINAAKGYREIQAGAEESLSAAQKLTIWGEGFNASLKKLGGTVKSTLAAYFEPALAPLAAITNKVNELTSKLGELAQKRPSVAKAVGWSALGAVGVGGLATVGLGARAMLNGKKFLSGVGGLKGLLGSAGSATAGIAKGMAVEAATGVQAVFVTNWPDGIGGGVLSKVTPEDSLLKKAGGKAAGWVDKVPSFLPKSMLAKLATMGNTGATLAGGVGAAGVGTAALALAISGAVGLAVGAAANKYLINGTEIGSEVGDKIGEWTNRLAALFGNEESKRAIEMNIQIDQHGRVVTETNDMQTKVETKVNKLNRGKF